MINNKKHSSVFQDKSNKKNPVEVNLDKIIHQTNLKMKEFMLKKSEYNKNTTLVRGQRIQCEDSLLHLNEMNEQKMKQIQNNQTILANLNEEINQKEKELHNLILQIQQNDAKLKDNINEVNSKLNSIQMGSIPEKSQKNAELKKQIEILTQLRKENSELEKQYLHLNSDLYTAETLRKNEMSKEHEHALRAQKGILELNKIYETSLNMNKQQQNYNINKH
jgi:hypothetical protein